ncbi:heterocyst development glycosyltransferase HepC [Nodularia sp. UHCC 0506]|uniref:heterocyst development glycosyltransferase HepC n=1 Tax=Nodularia sp. UHCC 0506 TaxID=3110243 RepID=UPI002B1F05E2|nr:heterocyst development glycosyltransferase HepC [Nodularia sp. UHCC 0506]MEA5513213.1 heterocyst development glycosyltransferase HepC [Nodularia sp. UHCC 0506]
MTTSLVPALQNSYSETQAHKNNHFSSCTLQWRRGQLLVKSASNTQKIHLPSLHDEELLVRCLEKTLVNVVSIDPNVGEYDLKLWVEACEQAGKPIFLRLPSSNKQFKQVSRWQKLIDWIAALFLLVIMSPIMLGLFVILQIESPGSAFSSEWQVGERGKIFRAIKFCTTSNLNITPLVHLMRKYDLDHLPQLWNVLRGEMTLMGSRTCTLENAVRITLAGQQQMNQLSKIKDAWEESSLLHLDSQTL